MGDSYARMTRILQELRDHVPLNGKKEETNNASQGEKSGLLFGSRRPKILPRGVILSSKIPVIKLATLEKGKA